MNTLFELRCAALHCTALHYGTLTSHAGDVIPAPAALLGPEQYLVAVRAGVLVTKVGQVDQPLGLQMLVTAVVAGYLVIDPGLGVQDQVLLPGWQGLPAGSIGPFAPGTIVDPIEDEKDQHYQ